MFNNNLILVVIPARGGSKGIPRKNLRLLNNKPLISYSIEAAKASQYVDDVVVTTDDSQIALIAEKFGASVVRRSDELATDEVSLDPVIHDAMIQKEKQAFDEYDIIITLQPTSPLIKTETLDNAIEKFEDFSLDSVISVVDDRHLSWGYDEDNRRYFPNYIERVDTDLLPKSFRETGAILATRRQFVHEDSRLGTNIDIVEVSREERVNIQTYEDWWIAENYLQKKRTAIVVNASEEIGVSHINRCLSLASKLVFHEVLFLIDEHYQLGIDIVDRNNFSYKTYDDKNDLLNFLKQYSPQIVINDILDTSVEYISALKEEGYFVVNFEDLGVGSDLADVVFDDLYEHELGARNVFTGHKYFVLKDEFYYQPPKIITNAVNRVLIAFGQFDSNNVTEKIIDSILATNYEGRIDVILGLDYEGLDDLISKYESNPLIQIYRNVPNVSEFIFKADVIFTSPNKSMYEICSIGVPTICLCQDDRDVSHVFANNNNGFINMGRVEDLSKQDIVDQFVNIVNDFDLRMEMHKKMLSIDLKNGFENILAVIEEEYRKFEFNKNH
ncbi:MAG: UDP-2,4-diacetamido-2,4,6-trideoxy-beta-L-altropyranose hydrolase [Methanobrevibacter sp.]|uniref:cytidylyltransferase domain-containing protein n=1 Tax=Methanobrevibacter sp. TaxID=66852 RepID=UPI0025D7B9EF|nr:UDP-2,4-diacetamido-2,4,6-trideoxy-beta-L-altropyranose hydrolase [Methanobrevibacter sp.]MBQ6099467.1 UDP-2,4-diacetamido-2,4,6-trideoxy-beta-L-altropyranose hydrolase [Methanobrevibacter sp.]